MDANDGPDTKKRKKRTSGARCMAVTAVTQREMGLVYTRCLAKYHQDKKDSPKYNKHG